jgi:putative FmdB family regulatory protein
MGESREYYLDFSGGRIYICARRREEEGMPIYEYLCGGCGHRKEILHKIGKTTVRPACPECGKRMKKMISSAAFILKGSGWHVTDYPSQSRKEGLESEGKEKSPPKETETKAKPAPEKKEKKKKSPQKG